ncbi:YD repeat protein [Reticulomyxa filosa]|uniref:YD repeat protein n=1 Tax=Reticulomyxa filosa TaxID=46433 RepID=X6LUC0_RETFI|nr:YD repeat protein [Reticulomyxa filosa]|eukprot:ETO04737.1 YD repeat protein [Reticulomyxa filosa]
MRQFVSPKFKPFVRVKYRLFVFLQKKNMKCRNQWRPKNVFRPESHIVFPKLTTLVEKFEKREGKSITSKSIDLLKPEERRDMAKRVNRQLKKQLEEQKNLEDELEKLQNAKDPKESCAEVIKLLNSTSLDPMPDRGMCVACSCVINQTKKQRGEKKENNPFVQVSSCFVAGTEILVSKAGEHKKIEDLEIGDTVICLVPTHGTFKESIDCDIKDIPKHFVDAVVTAIHKSPAFHICSIQYRNQSTNEERTIECTDSHPLYVYKEGWKNVSGVAKRQYAFEIGTLKVGDALCLQSGDLAYITHIHRTCLKDPITVFNLTASKGHTFFANHVFVHNKCGPCAIL